MNSMSEHFGWVEIVFTAVIALGFGVYQLWSVNREIAKDKAKKSAVPRDVLTQPQSIGDEGDTKRWQRLVRLLVILSAERREAGIAEDDDDGFIPTTATEPVTPSYQRQRPVTCPIVAGRDQAAALYALALPPVPPPAPARPGARARAAAAATGGAAPPADDSPMMRGAVASAASQSREMAQSPCRGRRRDDAERMRRGGGGAV